VKQQTAFLYNTLDNSVFVARNGIELCDYFLVLCDLLLQRSVIQDEAREFIRNMRNIAARAQQDANSTTESFRTIRRGLMEISKHIPQEVDILRHNQAQAEHLKDEAMRRNQNVLRLTEETAKRLPIFSSAINSLGRKLSKKHVIRVEEQAKIIHRNSIDLEKLTEVSGDVAETADHVDVLVNRWIEIDVGLKEVETMVGRISAENPMKIRIRTMEKAATSIRDLYKTYEEEFTRLQVEYPANPWRHPPENLSCFLGNTARARKHTLDAEWADYLKSLEDYDTRTVVETHTHIDRHDGMEELYYDD